MRMFMSGLLSLWLFLFRQIHHRRRVRGRVRKVLITNPVSMPQQTSNEKRLLGEPASCHKGAERPAKRWPTAFTKRLRDKTVSLRLEPRQGVRAWPTRHLGAPCNVGQRPDGLRKAIGVTFCSTRDGSWSSPSLTSFCKIDHTLRMTT